MTCAPLCFSPAPRLVMNRLPLFDGEAYSPPDLDPLRIETADNIAFHK